MESILLSVKKMLGIEPEYNHFDSELIMYINSVFTVLNQLSVGPESSFSIHGEEDSWSDFFGDQDTIELVKAYMYLKVRLIFDPPTTGVLHEAMERQVQEFEWRLNIQAEGGD